MKADYRLLILLALAVVFMLSAMQHPSEQPVFIEGNFVAFDKAEVFDMPILAEECSESSPRYIMPVF